MNWPGTVSPKNVVFASGSEVVDGRSGSLPIRSRTVAQGLRSPVGTLAWVGRGRSIFADTRADHDRPRPALGDAVVGGEQHAVRELVVAEHPAVGLVEQELELRASPEALDVLDDEDLRVRAFDDLQVALPQLVAWVVDVLAAEVGEALARRSADDDVGLGDVALERIVDVAPEGVALAEVGGVGGRGVKVPLDGQHRLEAVTA